MMAIVCLRLRGEQGGLVYAELTTTEKSTVYSQFELRQIRQNVTMYKTDFSVFHCSDPTQDRPTEEEMIWQVKTV